MSSDDDLHQQILMPDGNILQFPAGMSDADMAAAIKANTPGVGSVLSDVSTQALKGIPGTGGQLGAPINAAVSAMLHPVAGTGQPGATFMERYGKDVSQRRNEAQEFETLHPAESQVLQTVGGAAATAPFAAVGTGAKALGMTGGMFEQPVASGVTNAALSASDAYARGEDPVPSAVVGGMFGSTIPAVSGIVKRGTSAIADRFIPPPPGPLANMDRQSLRWAYNAAKNDGLTDAEIMAKEAELGPQGMLMEYGPNLRGLAGGVAAKPGPGKTDVFAALNARAKEAPSTIDKSLTDTMGPKINIPEYSRFLADSRKAAADPWYEQFRTMSIHPTKALQDLMPRLEASGAGAEGRHLMEVEGKDWLKNFFVSGPQKEFPTAEAYDYMKRGLDSVIEKSKPWGSDPNPNRLRVYGNLKSEFLDALENHPDPNVGQVYKRARQSYADPTGLMNALRDGGNWQDIHKDELPYVMQNYSPMEKKAFMQGVRGNFDDMLNDTARGGSKVQNFLLAPSNEDKLRALVGDKDKVDNLVSEMNRQKTFAETRSRTIQGSETEPRRSMGQMIEPNAHDNAIAKAREMYALHVTPFRYIPFGGMAEKAAAEEQASSFEKSRGALGKALTKGGPEAANFARALAGYKPPSQVEGPMLGYWTNLLMHGYSPQAIQQLKQRGMNFGQSQQ